MDSPTEAIRGAASNILQVQDDYGRALALRRLTALDRLRLFKAIGPHLAQNAPYLGMAMLACSITAIDGVPIPAPVTEAQVESLVSRLGDAGIAAAALALSADNTTALGKTAQGN